MVIKKIDSRNQSSLYDAWIFYVLQVLLIESQDKLRARDKETDRKGSNELLGMYEQLIEEHTVHWLHISGLHLLACCKQKTI